MFQEIEAQLFRDIGSVADTKKVDAYLVGGYVRDLFLKRTGKDADVVVIGNGVDFARACAKKLLGHEKIAIFKTYGTAMFRTSDGFELEFVGARKESYKDHSRNPEVQPGTLQEDQERRDFTINALAISLNKNSYGKLLDPFDGVKDIEEKIIRTPLDPETTFSDDPLRMMRAIRFATQLNFHIEERTLEAISTQKERIKIVSQERISTELNKIILSPVPSVGFKLLFETGLLQIIFPEFVLLHGVDYKNGKGHKDNFYHTLQVLDNLCQETDDLWLRWAAILHDIAKPQTKRFEPEHGWTFHGHEDKGSRMVPAIFRRMKLPLDEHMKYVQKLVLLHLRPIVLAQTEVTDSAIRRLIVDAGEDVNDLLKLCKADITSKNEVKVKKYLRNLEIVKEKIADVTERDRLRNWQPPIDGNIIMDTFIISDPRKIGELKNIIREAILEGDIPNDFEPAYAFMLQKGEELGLERKKQ